MSIIAFLAFLISSALAALILYERYLLQGFLDNFTLLLVVAFCSFSAFCLVSFYKICVKKSDFVRSLWLGLLSIILTYTAADILGGLFFIPPLSPALTGDAKIHHRLLPNTHSAIYSRDFNYIQRVNNLGLRGRDIDVEKKANVLRIAMLGDSFTMGKGVEDDETFSSMLENALNQSTLQTIEILNAGVDSYAPILSFLQLKNQLMAYEPDLVILNLDMSYLLQEMAYRQRAVYDASGELLGVDGRLEQLQLTRTQKARNWINEHLFFSRLIIYHIQHWAHQHSGINVANVVGIANPAILAHTLKKDNHTTARSDQWMQLFTSIRAIQSLCDKEGISFLLTTYPWGHQVNEHEWLPGRFAFVTSEDIPSDASLNHIRQLARESNIDFLDVFADFQAYSGSENLYYNNDMHWTPRGHQLMADAIENYLYSHYSTLLTEKHIP